MIMAFERLSLARDGGEWPNRELSTEVRAEGLRWHVQIAGASDAPALFLIHGTGASTHSWADLIHPLAAHFRVVAADAPGHGFTSAPPSYRLSLGGMAAAHAALLKELDVVPAMIAAHSAGAAIALRMCLDRAVSPEAVLAFNGALMPFHGLPGQIFPVLARALFINPVTPRVFAWTAQDRARVERLVIGTGSAPPPRSLACYATLFRNPGHVASALGMMAHWRLEPLVEALPALTTRLALLVGEKDGAVPPGDAERVAKLAPKADLTRWSDAGHLAHEEHPDRAVAWIRQIAQAQGVLAAAHPAAEET